MGVYKETAETTGDLKYREVDYLRPLENRETTGDCRNHWGLAIQYGVLLQTSRDKVDCRKPQGPLGT